MLKKEKNIEIILPKIELSEYGYLYKIYLENNFREIIKDSFENIKETENVYDITLNLVFYKPILINFFITHLIDIWLVLKEFIEEKKMKIGYIRFYIEGLELENSNEYYFYSEYTEEEEKLMKRRAIILKDNGVSLYKIDNFIKKINSFLAKKEFFDINAIVKKAIGYWTGIEKVYIKPIKNNS